MAVSIIAVDGIDFKQHSAFSEVGPNRALDYKGKFADRRLSRVSGRSLEPTLEDRLCYRLKCPVYPPIQVEFVTSSAPRMQAMSDAG
jgi:hypothetical protein